MRCNYCGEESPSDQMYEVFVSIGNIIVKRDLCSDCAETDRCPKRFVVLKNKGDRILEIKKLLEE